MVSVCSPAAISAYSRHHQRHLALHDADPVRRLSVEGVPGNVGGSGWTCHPSYRYILVIVGYHSTVSYPLTGALYTGIFHLPNTGALYAGIFYLPINRDTLFPPKVDYSSISLV